jgi:hypothetical protein
MTPIMTLELATLRNNPPRGRVWAVPWLTSLVAALAAAGCGGGGSDSTTTSSSSTSSTSTTSTTSASGCGLGTSLYVLTSGSATVSSASYAVSTADESAVCATDYDTSITLTSPTIISSGSTSSTDNSSFYGLDAAVLAYGSSSSTDSGGSITITGGSISTSGTGGNGVFASGLGSTVTISGTSITATGANAHGLDAAYAGTLIIDNVTATTSGQSGSVIATDRGGGTVTVMGGTYSASGYRSAGLYSTGSVIVSSATLVATDAEAVVVEGSNSATLTNSSLTGGGGDYRGVFLYNSASGDASSGTGYFTMTGGSLTYTSTSGSAFAVANQTGVIKLSGITLSNAASNLLTAAAISSWGTSGSNGGQVTFTASGQALTGNVVVDAISTAAITLASSSTLSGAINAADTAESVTLTLDSTSIWTVTGTSYLTVLDDTSGISGTAISNIVGNGYTVYYLSASNTALGGLNYTLSGGGYLKPI